MKNFVSVGECMLELSNIEDRIFKMGFAGDTLNTAWYARVHQRYLLSQVLK